MGGKQKKRKGARTSNAGKAQAFAQTCMESMQSSKDKREQNRRRMRVVQLQRSVDRKLQELRAYPKNPPPPKPPARKGPKPPSEWKLKGAARPAALLAKIAAGELDECGNEFPKPVETFDLYEKMLKEGKMAEHKDTREYISLLKQLAAACCEAGMPDRGIKNYELCMSLDKTDSFYSREGLACALVDEGRGAEARALIEEHKDEDSAVLAYCQVIIEYVSWEVLEEEGSSEEVVQKAFRKAFALNPFMAVVTAYHETFFQVMEYVEEIKDPKRGSIEEAFVYVSQNIGLWVDTVGAYQWIEKELNELSEPAATKEDVSDEMYLGMYETAIEMHKEMLAEAEAEAEVAAAAEVEGSDAEEDDRDEFGDFEPDAIDGGDD
ncbi:hypothetical protein F441_02619 [Phytophthora nicotianae CJ01A1]|uniref:Uncharacterized protein n=5 Tax=Phytophthora nicotianae TaxID=4792 RepID=W2PDJ9_PHYN3|nr:hypothetical protein PPTG_19294 [Phytophthora nicotianae INRA-310]ETI54522.1 hypothetical protein F443_02657 [Phytophthora nicotianae P1569]ETK94375.1 hypothetical protein L915_02539 [Phytophthora nicotianae]ETO83274.1 hypothetical protein F444_02658 [Phytophthora nicotianae P1976]ETP24353.1 hypothetical protein F441_02619 [Phytophthora nicotianae CJ01A1]KUF98015.1 Regulator of G-protein signaling 5 [Phytophthora nicotianae]